MEIQKNSVLLFAAWLKSHYPKLYAAALNKTSGLGAVDTAASTAPTTAGTTSWLDTIQNMLKQAVPVYLATYQQKQLIDVNVARAKAGLPPIDQSSFSPQVNVGVSPQVTDTAKIALYGLMGLGALFLISKRKR